MFHILPVNNPLQHSYIKVKQYAKQPLPFIYWIVKQPSREKMRAMHSGPLLGTAFFSKIDQPGMLWAVEIEQESRRGLFCFHWNYHPRFSQERTATGTSIGRASFLPTFYQLLLPLKWSVFLNAKSWVTLLPLIHAGDRDAGPILSCSQRTQY